VFTTEREGKKEHLARIKRKKKKEECGWIALDPRIWKNACPCHLVEAVGGKRKSKKTGDRVTSLKKKKMANAGNRLHAVKETGAPSQIDIRQKKKESC